MKFCITIILLVISVLASGQKIKSYDYCYESKNGICVYSLTEKKEIVLPIKYANYPSISPDGTKITYTETSEDGGRNICIFNIATLRIKRMNIHSKYCYGSVWSCDGRYIAYNVLHDEAHPYDWGVSIIDTGNTKVIGLNKYWSIKPSSLYSPTWTENSNMIIVHDMDSVFIFNILGKVISKFKVKEFGASSSDRCILVSGKLIFDATVDEPDLWEFNEPPIAIFQYDTLTQVTRRITPTGYCAMFPFANKEKIYFECMSPKSKDRDTYSVDLNGNYMHEEFKNYRSFTTRRN